MFICLEGPDCAGKTTLAQEFVTQWGAKGHTVLSWKRGPIQSDVMTEYVKPLELHTTFANPVIILDRWHVGELIYGPLLRDQSQLSEVQSWYVEMILNTFGAHFIHVTARTSVLNECIWQRGDDLVTSAIAIEAAKMYDDYVRDPLRTHWVTLDTMHQIPKIEWRDASPFAGIYIGPVKPRVLLFGDVRGHEEMLFPFVPRRNTSGYWLINSLLAGGVNPLEVGIVNANELSDGSRYILWDLLERPPLVALGVNAFRALQASELVEQPMKQLPHPQYMRRFRNTDHESYGQLIKAAMKD